MDNKMPSFRETQLHLSGKVLHTWGDIGGREERGGERQLWFWEAGRSGGAGVIFTQNPL
jgi:hypothetical protein